MEPTADFFRSRLDHMIELRHPEVAPLSDPGMALSSG